MQNDKTVPINVDEYEKLLELVRSMARDLDSEHGWNSSHIADRSLPKSTELYADLFKISPSERDEQGNLA